MATITQIKNDQYTVSNGDSIIKKTDGWYVMSKAGVTNVGPLPTLEAAKEYVDSNDSDPQEELTPEDHKIDKGPAILWGVVMLSVCLLLLFIRNY